MNLIGMSDIDLSTMSNQLIADEAQVVIVRIQTAIAQGSLSTAKTLLEQDFIIALIPEIQRAEIINQIKSKEL